jgi:hypothetical protein
MKIINLTPHPLVIQRGEEQETIESSGVARCVAQEEVIGEIDGILVVRTTFGEVVGLPNPSMYCRECGSVIDFALARKVDDAFREEFKHINADCASFGGACVPTHGQDTICLADSHDPEWLAGEQPGQMEPVFFIVSSIVAQAVPERADVFVPAQPVRDEKGRIIACRALGRIA